MRSLLPLLLLVPTLAQAAPDAFRFRQATDEQRLAAVHAFSSLPGGWARVDAASEAFLGTAYVVSPLGEGSGLDPDPRLRWDGVDCLTLVETALALGNSADSDQARAALDDIRYTDGSAPAFENRLHLMIAQWIPDQIAKGYLEDVTEALAEVVQVEVSYDEARWNDRPGALRPLPWQEALRGTFRLPMIPLREAQAIAAELPEGLVLNVVRQARADRMNLVTHTGLVVVRNGRRFVRHASSIRREVVDEPIERFLARHGRMRQWRVEGINLLRVRDNRGRVERLAPRPTTLAADAGEPSL